MMALKLGKMQLKCKVCAGISFPINTVGERVFVCQPVDFSMFQKIFGTCSRESCHYDLTSMLNLGHFTSLNSES